MGIKYEKDYLLSAHSSFKIGGRADLALFPRNEEELRNVVLISKELGVKTTVIGRASNVLFSDKGYRGAVIFTELMSEITVREDGDTAFVDCLCGAPLSALAMRTAKAGLSGLEFLHGIPGSLGGAVCMNAGAFGKEISEAITQVRAYDSESDEFISLSDRDCAFSYRHSLFTDRKRLLCVGATLSAEKGESREILERIEAYKQKRLSSQPYTMASAGSFFKRPDGYFAAKLIDDCGLKGMRVGDACVSEKHAGFIVNLGSARAKDVLTLSEAVARRVFDEYGVSLEREVVYIEE